MIGRAPSPPDRGPARAVATVVAAVTLLLVSCKGDKKPPPPSEPDGPLPKVSVPDLMGKKPTFVAGTSGDIYEDRRIATQIALLRGLALPDTKVIADHEITGAGWPDTPVLYGNMDTNAALAAVSATVPFKLTRKVIEIGGETFSGPGYRLIAAVPADGTRPAMVVFGGTGRQGIAEINALTPSVEPILVADVFGPLVTGRWVRRDGEIVAELGERKRRIEYRSETKRFRIGSATFLFPEMVAPRDADKVVIEAATRALATVAAKLDLKDLMLAIYVYPDRGSKRSLTGRAGDGHAVPSSRALHIIGAPGPALESLIAHEATHVILYNAWGPSGTALMGEGVAVWVAGGYAGKSLKTWAKSLEMIPTADLLGPEWIVLDEAAKYPLAGLLVDIAVAEVGLENLRKHLIGASFETWEAACQKAGTTAAILERKLSERLGK